jgi:hypothetical protein
MPNDAAKDAPAEAEMPEMARAVRDRQAEADYSGGLTDDQMNAAYDDVVPSGGIETLDITADSNVRPLHITPDEAAAEEQLDGPTDEELIEATQKAEAAYANAQAGRSSPRRFEAAAASRDLAAEVEAAGPTDEELNQAFDLLESPGPTDDQLIEATLQAEAAYAPEQARRSSPEGFQHAEVDGLAGDMDSLAVDEGERANPAVQAAQGAQGQYEAPTGADLTAALDDYVASLSNAASAPEQAGHSSPEGFQHAELDGLAGDMDSLAAGDGERVNPAGLAAQGAQGQYEGPTGADLTAALDDYVASLSNAAPQEMPPRQQDAPVNGQADDAASLSGAEGASLGGAGANGELELAYVRQMGALVSELPEGEGPLARYNRTDLTLAMADSALDIHARIESARPNAAIDTQLIVATIAANMGRYEDGEPDAGYLAHHLGERFENPGHNAGRAADRQAESASAPEAGPSNAAPQEAPRRQPDASVGGQRDDASSSGSDDGYELSSGRRDRVLPHQYAGPVANVLGHMAHENPAFANVDRRTLVRAATGAAVLIHNRIEERYPGAQIDPHVVVGAVVRNLGRDDAVDSQDGSRPYLDAVADRLAKRFDGPHQQGTQAAGPANAGDAQHPGVSIEDDYRRRLTPVVNALPEGEGPLARFSGPGLTRTMVENAVDIHSRIEAAYPNAAIDSNAVVGALRANLGAYEDMEPNTRALADHLGQRFENAGRNAAEAQQPGAGASSSAPRGEERGRGRDRGR